MTRSLESAAIVGEVYDRHIAVHFSGYETLEELAEDWPDGFYVWCVHERLTPLVDAFERLWLIDRMFGIKSLPLYGDDDAFVSRAEWLRLTHELVLVRLAGIRDLCALLVAAVFELGIEPRRVSIQRILRERVIRENEDLAATLQSLSDAVPDLRDERNKLIHHGVRRAFGEHRLFDIVSHCEAARRPMKVEPIAQPDGTTHEFHLETEHARIAGELEEEYATAAAELGELCMSVLDMLVTGVAPPLSRKAGWVARKPNKRMQTDDLLRSALTGLPFEFAADSRDIWQTR